MPFPASRPIPFVAGYLSSAYKDMIAYALLLLFLFVKPTGIFNERAISE